MNWKIIHELNFNYAMCSFNNCKRDTNGPCRTQTHFNEVAQRRQICHTDTDTNNSFNKKIASTPELNPYNIHALNKFFSSLALFC